MYHTVLVSLRFYFIFHYTFHSGTGKRDESREEEEERKSKEEEEA